MSKEIPYGFCHCGCGQKTTIPKQTRKERGAVKGEPVKYLVGHGLGTPRVVSMGDRFTRLVVKAKDGKYFLCVCDCGKERKVHRSNLLSGRTHSCGCLSSESASARLYKHGNARIGVTTTTYLSWRNMLVRCTNPKDSHYKNYGGRGISVCERWKSFENFLMDMGDMPKGLSIERKNNTLGYYPDNCVWATSKEQARNRRSNRLVTIGGRTQILTQWLEELGVNEHTVWSRLRRGMSYEDALTTPVKVIKVNRNP